VALVDLHIHWKALRPSSEIEVKIPENPNFTPRSLKYHDGILYINTQKVVSGIAEKVWKFRIGKYQVCRKWWKDRLGRKIADEDIKAFLKIIHLIQKTLAILTKLDALNWDSVFNQK
jgi:hypothetical protein